MDMNKYSPRIAGFTKCKQSFKVEIESEFTVEVIDDIQSILAAQKEIIKEKTNEH